MLSDLVVLRERLDRIEETEGRALDTRMCRRCVRPYRQTPMADRDRCESCGETHAGAMDSLRRSHAIDRVHAI